MPERTTLIIGGGIVGVCSAYELARRGERVVLLERGKIAGEASGGNAGQMAIAHPPIPRPGLAAKAVRWMFDPMSPLHITPRAGWGMVPWLWTFWRACSQSRLDRSMDALAAMGRLTRPIFDEIVEAESIECDYQPVGGMEVFRTEHGAEDGRAFVRLMKKYGVDADWLDAGELVEREPCFKPGVVGAALNRENISLDPGAFTAGVARGSRRLGVEIREHSPVGAVVVESGRAVGVRLESGERVDADRVVLAAGVWSDSIARTAGVRVPMQACKGYHREIEQDGPPLRTPCVCAERFVACTTINGRLRLAGTLEFSGINCTMRRERLDALSRGADEYLSGVSGKPALSEWCGLRPCVADGMPVIGWAPRVGGLLVATGHAMLGMTLGPATGRLVAELLLGDTPSVDLSTMRADRF